MDTQDAIGIRITELVDSRHSPNAVTDEKVRAELDDASTARDLLGQLTPLSTPVGFSRRVQTRVRRRTGGRYFHPMQRPFGYVVSVEAFVVLAVAVMAACWLMLERSGDGAPAVLYPDPPPVDRVIEDP